jgi:DNA replication protein DnaC
MMLTQQTVEKLHTLRLRGMAEAFREQEQDPEIHRLSFEERLGLLVDRQWNWKHNQALERRLINARLRGNACIENINYRASRGLDRQQLRSLTLESAWVREHQNIFLVGATGVGKTYLARALGQKACRDGYKALFIKATQLFRDLAMARADGSVGDLLYRLGRVDVLIVKFHRVRMDKIHIEPTAADAIRRELAEMGIRHATVYGELGAVCRALAREHGIQLETPDSEKQKTLFK